MTGHVVYKHITVDATPDVVWDVITDVANADSILRSVSKSALITEGDYSVGTTWSETRKIFGHHGAEELHVTECDPPIRTMVETKLGRDIVRTAFNLTPTGENSTKVSMTTTAEMSERSPAGTMAWNFFGGFSYEITRRMLEHDLEDIAAEAVRRAGAKGSRASAS